METHTLAPETRHNTLQRALEATFNMEEEDAQAIAGVVVDAFAGDTEVADDELPTDVRSIFYTLEAKKLLAFRREERADPTSGARVRAFYWHLRDETLQRQANRTPLASHMTIYDQLPAAAWARGAS